MLKKYIGILLIITSCIILFIQTINNYQYEIKEEKEINYYFNENANNDHKDHYIAVIEIPKIKLKKGFYSIYSKSNNVDKNIEILFPSDMPDTPNGNLILASHSGNSKISYFKNLDTLNLNDKINIYYNKEKYTYKLTNIYQVNKTGTIEIFRNQNKRTLTLITCDKKDKTKQIVFISELDTIE